MGTAWAGGINLHAAALMPGIMAMTGGATLPPGLDILTKHAVLPAAGFMYGGSDSCPTSHEEKGHPPDRRVALLAWSAQSWRSVIISLTRQIAVLWRPARLRS